MAGDWVLITDGGDGQARSSLAAVRALAQAGYRPAVTVSGRSSLAAASRFCQRRVRVPLVSEPGYAEAVRTEMDAHPYLTVIAASDAALLALGMPVGHLVDKTRLIDCARRAEVSVPPTRVFATRDELLAAGAVSFPAVLKPAVSTVPARLVRTRAELSASLNGAAPFVVQPYLSNGLRAIAGVLWKGWLIAVVHQRYLRTWPGDCGTASAAVSVDPDLALEQRLVRLLDGYDGIFQAQLAGEDLLDLNPRVYGSLPLAVAAGVNLPAVYCELVAGGGLPEVTPLRARPGVFYRWLEGDLRHAAWAVRDGRMTLRSALAALRPRFGAAHSTEWLSDPMPMVARFRHALSRRAR